MNYKETKRERTKSFYKGLSKAIKGLCLFAVLYWAIMGLNAIMAILFFIYGL